MELFKRYFIHDLISTISVLFTTIYVTCFYMAWICLSVPWTYNCINII